MEDYWQSVFENPNGDTDFFSACKKKYPNVRPRDLWLANASYEGPAASGYINTSAACSVGTFDLCSKPATCHPYPGFRAGEEVEGCTYVDETFASEAVRTVQELTRHPSPTP